MQRHNRFERGSACFNCGVCGRQTRNTGDNAGCDLCPQCYEVAGIENMITDGNYESPEQKAKLEAEINKLNAEVIAKGGQLSRQATEEALGSLTRQLPHGEKPMKSKTEFSNEQINEVMAQRGTTRKSAIRWLNRNREDRPKGKATGRAKDFKSAAAHDVVEAPAAKLPAKNASLVAKGAAYHVLAGRPSKDAVVKCFGKSGYALSWVSRAERLGVTPQELCEQFATNPARVKDQWAALAEAK